MTQSPSMPKRGLKKSHKINLAGVIIAFLLLILTAIGIFKPELFGSKKNNPCAALKKKEELKIKKINDLVNARENCTDKDSIELYYDFEIRYANAELKNIKNSIDTCTN